MDETDRVNAVHGLRIMFTVYTKLYELPDTWRSDREKFLDLLWRFSIPFYDIFLVLRCIYGQEDTGGYVRSMLVE